MSESALEAVEGLLPPGSERGLTVGSLLAERMMRHTAPPVLDAALAREPIKWCLPWETALASTDSLAGVVVFAMADQINDPGLHTLSRRRAVAVVSSGGTRTDVGGAVPVFAVPNRVGFRDLNYLVANLVLSRETHVLRYGLTVHRGLAELLYRGAGLAALCHHLTRLSECATAILDPDFRVLAFEQSRDRTLDPSAIATAFRDAKPMTPEGDELTAALQMFNFETDGGVGVGMAKAILLAGRHDGWVVIVEADESPSEHDLAQHRSIIGEATMIIGTELLRMHSVEEAEERARGDFVHALLHGRFRGPHDLEARAAHYGLPLKASYGVIVAGHLDTADGTESLNALFQIARVAARIMPHTGMQTWATVVGNVLAVVRQCSPAGSTSSAEDASKALASYARALEDELERRIHHPVAVGFGRPARGADHIAGSYREARLALGLHHRLGLTQPCGFAELRVYAVLSELVGNPQAQAFSRDILRPLRSQRHADAGLEQAVMTYIAEGGNVNAAARKLHVHRNTMMYKLNQASQALQVDLREAEHQFAVWFAYKLDMLADTNAAIDREVRRG